jgi:hypothetical protein
MVKIDKRKRLHAKFFLLVHLGTIAQLLLKKIPLQNPFKQFKIAVNPLFRTQDQEAKTSCPASCPASSLPSGF